MSHDDACYDAAKYPSEQANSPLSLELGFQIGPPALFVHAEEYPRPSSLNNKVGRRLSRAGEPDKNDSTRRIGCLRFLLESM